MLRMLELLKYGAYLEIVKALDRMRKARTQADRDSAALSALTLLPDADFDALRRMMDRAVVERASHL